MTHGRNTHDVVSAHLVGFAPGTHDKGIVESNDSDNINALLAELGKVFDVSRHVVDGASWGEGTWLWEESQCQSRACCTGIPC